MDVTIKCEKGVCEDFKWNLEPLMNDPTFKEFFKVKPEAVWKDYNGPLQVISLLTSSSENKIHYLGKYLD